MAMEMIDLFGSSNIAAVGYDPDTETLAVQFWRGKGENKTKGETYYYLDVPISEYAEMLKAESIGRYFASHIKGQYETEKENNKEE